MRLLPALALSAALATGACTNPDGTLNVPGTVALGAGAAIAGLAIASANDGSRHHHYRNRGHAYGRPTYGYGRPAYGHGYGRPRYRRW
ncbi:MAG TPA: hypothetical protein VGN83_21425 [Falsiroseomonas sp.]|jgi:ribonucleotide monophosphatase NagD (HAD superfamily)|nr:hypothetical protein [Falsiroseomonas sp.]